MDQSSNEIEKADEKPLNYYSIEELMKWRNAASKRVDFYDKDNKELQKIIDDNKRQIDRNTKKRYKDIKWIMKLNRALRKKVLKYRPSLSSEN